MKISYYLNGERKKNLYCRISDGAEKVTFSMGYTVSSDEWNSKKEEINNDDPHCFSLVRFKDYLTQRYHELKKEGKTEVLTRLKNEALSMTDDLGIEGIDRKLFDRANEGTDVPKYDDFICAFEKFTKLKRDEYKVETLDSLIHFHVKDVIYEMDTYEGKTKQLTDLIENDRYEDILLLTDVSIWGEIYIDGGIEKTTFLSMMLNLWEEYWNKKSQEEMELQGKIDRLKYWKEKSWRAFQVYMECYNSEADVISMANTIDPFILYPVAVLTMMNCFDKECCYSEYCDAEFNGNGWECIEDEDNENPYFYIRTYEL